MVKWKKVLASRNDKSSWTLKGTGHCDKGCHHSWEYMHRSLTVNFCHLSNRLVHIKYTCQWGISRGMGSQSGAKLSGKERKIRFISYSIWCYFWLIQVKGATRKSEGWWKQEVQTPYLPSTTTPLPLHPPLPSHTPLPPTPHPLSTSVD